MLLSQTQARVARRGHFVLSCLPLVPAKAWESFRPTMDDMPPGLGPGHPSDWCPLNPCQGRRQGRLRVYMCQAVLPFAVVLRS
jgi:hypothetical protein